MATPTLQVSSDAFDSLPDEKNPSGLKSAPNVPISVTSDVFDKLESSPAVNPQPSSEVLQADSSVFDALPGSEVKGGNAEPGKPSAPDQTGLVTEAELNSIAAKYGADPASLKDTLPLFGAFVKDGATSDIDLAKRYAGFWWRYGAANIPQKLYIMLQDEKTRSALDDLQQLAHSRTSFGETIAGAVAGGAIAAPIAGALAPAAAARLGSLGGSVSIDVAMGALQGAGEAPLGSELTGAAHGAAFGAAAGLGARAIGSLGAGRGPLLDAGAHLAGGSIAGGAVSAVEAPEDQRGEAFLKGAAVGLAPGLATYGYMAAMRGVTGKPIVEAREVADYSKSKKVAEFVNDYRKSNSAAEEAHQKAVLSADKALMDPVEWIAKNRDKAATPEERTVVLQDPEIKALVKKEAERWSMGGDEPDAIRFQEDLAAYYQTATDTVEYARFLVPEEFSGRSRSVKSDVPEALRVLDEVRNGRIGQVPLEEGFVPFRDAQLVTAHAFDPLRPELSKNTQKLQAAELYVPTTSIALRIIDTRHGSEWGPLFSDYTRLAGQTTIKQTEAIKDFSGLKSAAKKAGLSNEDVKAWVDGQGAVEGRQFSLAQEKVLQGFKEAGEKHRQAFNELGLPVTELAGSDGYWYANSVKETIPYIRAMRERLADLRQLQKLDPLAVEFSDAQYREALKLKDFNELAKAVEIRTGQFPADSQQFKKLWIESNDPSMTGDSTRLNAASTRKREGSIPEFIREPDPFKSSYNAIQAMYRFAIQREFAAKFKSAVPQLRALGDNAAAGYMERLTADMLGTRSGTLKSITAKKAAEFTLRMTETAETSGNPVARTLAEYGRVVPEIWSDLARQTMYANLLGGSPRITLMNASHPIFFAMPEVGISWGLPRTLWAYIKFVGAWTHGTATGKGIKQQLVEDGMQAPEYDSFSAEALQERLKLGLVGTAAVKSVKGLNHIAMSVDHWVDTMSRYNVRELANGMVDEVMGRGTSPKVAQTFLDHMAPGYQSKVLRAIKEGNEPVVKKTIQDYLLSKSILQNNSLSHSEWGRNWGPMFTPFTQMPFTVYGDAYYQLTRKGVTGASRLASTYGLPLAMAALAQNVIKEFLNKEEQQYYLGREGITGWGPIDFFTGAMGGRIISAPMPKLAMNSLVALLTADPAKGWQVMNDAARMATPGAWAIKFMTNDLPIIQGRMNNKEAAKTKFLEDLTGARISEDVQRISAERRDLLETIKGKE